MNPWWAFKFNESGGHESMFPDAQFQRSQDLDDLFCPTGSIWIANAKELKDSNTFYGNNYKFEEINWISAVDIDDYDDLIFAKTLKVLNVKIKINGDEMISDLYKLISFNHLSFLFNILLINDY